MQAGPLVNNENFHDACGTGFIVSLTGKPDTRVLKAALQGLKRLAHRGAISADGKTGDGSGILTDIPTLFFKNILKEEFNFSIDKNSKLAIAMVFTTKKEKPWLEDLIKNICAELKIKFICARVVPTRKNQLGEIAKKSAPEIYQFFFSVGKNINREVEPHLFLFRKKIEKEIISKNKKSYICSLSSKTIIYKGLMSSEQLDNFYPDLCDNNYVAKFAVFHERFSTNTRSTWEMAQPFRMIAHNGEINTIKGNRLWMQAREKEISSEYWGGDMKSLLPIVNYKGSDSSSLDNIVELLTRTGRNIFHSLLMLIPDPHSKKISIKNNLKDFFVYNENIMEPWDGPAAVVFTDGEIVGAKMDRNGLRPLRYTITKSGLVCMASEAGVLDVDDNDLLVHHHMTSGEIFGVSLRDNLILRNDEIKNSVSNEKPYTKILSKNLITLERNSSETEFGTLKLNEKDFDKRIQIALGWSEEDVSKFLIPMATSGREPVGSMGDDTPPAFLSEKDRKFYDFFKQHFAQVTNPPIDPIREHHVMALYSYIGSEENLLDPNPEFKGAIRILSPILSPTEVEKLNKLQVRFPQTKILCNYDKNTKIEKMLDVIRKKSLEAANGGSKIIVFSNENLNANQLPIPLPLVVSDIHHHLVKNKVRSKVSIICFADDVVEEHHIAVLVGLGASAVYPSMAYKIIYERFKNENWEEKLANYRFALEKGILKIISKMGISTLSSYHGGMLFNVIGINKKVIQKYFPSLTSNFSGFDLSHFHKISLERNLLAFSSQTPMLPDKGLFRFRKNGEEHGYSPNNVKWIHGIIDKTKKFEHVENKIVFIRDLLKINQNENSINIAQVEPAVEIMKRFGSGAISFGAISDISHRELARGMFLAGAKSNTGEGGEMHDRYTLTNPDKSFNSFVKQVASGRFGVTTEYLTVAKELQIKIAQGAKPGEGGQLPGKKVTNLIANARYATPGIPLISPPPHHDIYSIEDIKQLIRDLKEVNPRAKVSVKLVSQPGIGIIASGVVKAGADIILVSGGDGGTGASPISAIKHTGFPWEYGLAEVHQTLVENNLREQTIVRVDGGLKNGKDILIAAALGAEEYDFGTSLLIALGCVMVRQCHLNTCPTGIATQDVNYLKKFKGKSENIVTYLKDVAEEIRNNLSQLGFANLQSIIGRSDLLSINPEFQNFVKDRGIDLSVILNKKQISGLPIKSEGKIIHTSAKQQKSIDDEILETVRPAILTHGHAVVNKIICNKDRSIGTRISGEISFLHGKGNFNGEIQCRLHGVGGQSFGAFLTEGVELRLRGITNDYVGKGMSGGRITIRMPRSIRKSKREHTLIGNVALYGATGGSVYIAGKGGERFAVRNSGATAVIEGVGNHCCEYMTRGTVVILGEVGFNFGAGMTGGLAFIYTKVKSLNKWLNNDFVTENSLNESDEYLVLRLIRNHEYHTGSVIAKNILKKWKKEKFKFKKIVPLTAGEIDFAKIYDENIKYRLGIILNE